MKNWIKKDITSDQVKKLCQAYKLDPLKASILLRRGITSGSDLMFYLEDDMRYTHNPFLLNQMEDAVDRIIDAKEEGEKILIFGDRDVDGVTSTTLLYQALLDFGIKPEDLTYKIPTGDDPYGLTEDAVNQHAANYGSLIITVDCGISNHKEIELASNLGIDVIVTDHHNQNGQLSEPAIVVNPKRTDTTYPFSGISGCAVAFKLASALRFSKSDIYKQDVCLLSVRPDGEAFIIECAKLHNLVKKSVLTETIVPGTKRISDTRLVNYLTGQQIFVWDDKATQSMLQEIFGQGVEFNTFDIRPEVSKIFPAFSSMTLEALKDKSKIAFYNNSVFTELDAFENVFITYVNKIIEVSHPGNIKKTEEEIQLVMLAAIADIMPLQNENRIFVKHGLDSINSGKCRTGITELLARMNLLGKNLTSTDISWNVIPALNSCGRMGIPEVALNLLLEEDPAQRDKIAAQIIDTNTQRKSLISTAWELVGVPAGDTLPSYNNKFCVLIDERINRGILGLVASKLVQRYKVPSLCLTYIDQDTVIGSMRSCSGIDCTAILSSLGDIFINFGGHNAAAGFSLYRQNLETFLGGLKQISQTINLCSDNDDIIIDAQLPPEYLTPDILKLCDSFEPIGEANQTLQFMSTNLTVSQAQIVGKTEKTHLKLTLDNGLHKVPAMFWGAGAMLNKEICIGDKIDVVYNIERNIFNGMESMQLIIVDTNKN
ncbi:MAG: single-stranded-DNA-specific exonuclease RecJ [Treponema sp.]|nr:single-stranded-DNA-specific exonuclease RecJ [Treponema sp.]